MGAKILSRQEFATLAGVSQSAITQACSNGLRAAILGERIDASHPAALRYVETQQSRGTEGGLDPLYFDAVEWCRVNPLCTATDVRRHFKIGAPRAKALFDLMDVSGDLSETFAGSSPTPPSIVPDRTQSTAPATSAGVPNTATQLTGGAILPPAYATVDPSVSAGVASDIPENIQAFADMTLRDLIRNFGTDLRFTDWLKAIREIERIDEVRLKNAKTEGQLVSRERVKTGVFDPLDAAFRQLLTDGAKTLYARAVIMHDAGRTQAEGEAFVAEHIGSYIRPMKTRIVRGLRDA